MYTTGDTKMYVGSYHEYTEGCSVHLRDAVSTPGVFSTLEEYHEFTGRYHGYTRGFWYK